MSSTQQLRHLRSSLTEAARLHRLGLRAQAARGLASVVDGMETFLLGGEGAQPLAAVLLRILEAQERGDPIGIADLLEFELPALLGD